MNNSERELWVRNTESLYIWWRGSRKSMTQFLRDNRTVLDKYIKERI